MKQKLTVKSDDYNCIKVVAIMGACGFVVIGGLAFSIYLICKYLF